MLGTVNYTTAAGVVIAANPNSHPLNGAIAYTAPATAVIAAVLGLTGSVLQPKIPDFAAEYPIVVEWPGEVMTRYFHYGTHVEYFKFKGMDHISIRDEQGNNGLWLAYQFINSSLTNGNIYNIQLATGSAVANFPNEKPVTYFDTDGD